MKPLLKRLVTPTLKVLRGIGRLAGLAPSAPWATGGYGLACRGGLILLFLIGLVSSIWFRGAGLSIMIVAGLALLQFFLLQYRGSLLRKSTMIWLVSVTAVLGAVIVFVWSRWPGSGGANGDAMVVGAFVGAMVVLPFVRVLFREIFGPHHPESPLPEPQDPDPLWFWIGGVGPTEATIVARVADDVTADSVTVEYRTDGEAIRSEPVGLDRHRFARIQLSDLEPSTLHSLKVQACVGGGEPKAGTVPGSFTTFPPPREPATVKLAFASCMSTGSKGTVFDTIAQAAPQIFVVTGDLHYENINANRPERFLDAFDKVHSSRPQRRLYNAMPMAYVWDDHDFGDNDSGHDSPSKDAAQTAYRIAVPTYAQGDRAINQDFSIGRVRVVMTDNRSERGEESGHLMNRSQEEWLIERIVDPAWPVVIWVSTTPWISSDSSSDNWGAYPEQRRRIANAIAHRASNLVMVSGDAHMVALDDGSNSAYDEAGVGGFPVMHAAALDRKGGVKGGNFSHGKFCGAGQFGLITIDDEGGDDVTIQLSARSWTGAEIVGHTVTISTPAVAVPAADGKAAQDDLMKDHV